MSEENQNSPTVIEDPQTDFTPKDLALINEYKEAGTPGVARVDDVKLMRIMDMYLSGKTYPQISMVVGIPKQIILYYSQRYNWFQMKQDYLTDLESNIRGRVIEAKVVNQDFLLQLQQMWQKKIGNNIKKYLATDNEDYANAIDLKEVDKYIKSIETLQRLTSERIPGQQSPVVGLNLGEGITITKNSNNEVEITPKNRAIGDMLKQFADQRREEENKNKK